ncbi:hypothetical protein [Pontibacillus salipaludis]|uniref:KTSC domain-containing protein n=1 Tax=Pontibacillus salipaludis TaxID=1697394 RepID=A0ABQ1PZA2_9BACI|nr:hypothetical protein [Pontibacillus salipaludis]GGD07771.1 hypothetical protein GCM10011389_14140 [Pontibacillus salipaludis]
MEDKKVKISQHFSESTKLITTVYDAETAEVLYRVEMDSSELPGVQHVITEMAYEDALGFIYGCGYRLEDGKS